MQKLSENCLIFVLTPGKNWYRKFDQVFRFLKMMKNEGNVEKTMTAL